MPAPRQYEYKRNAMDCVKLAMRSPDPESKMVLRAMAQSWLKLAQEVSGAEELTAGLGAPVPVRH
jgi:hypothetical protein